MSENPNPKDLEVQEASEPPLPDGFWDRLGEKILQSRWVNLGSLFVILTLLVALFGFLPSLSPAFWAKVGLTQTLVAKLVREDLLRLILGVIIILLISTNKYLVKLMVYQKQLHRTSEAGIREQIKASSDLQQAVLSKIHKAQNLKQSNELLESFLRTHSQASEEWNHLSVLGLDLHSVVPLVRRWLNESRPTGWQIDLYLLDPDFARAHPEMIPEIWPQRARVAIQDIRDLIREAARQRVMISLYAYGHFPAVTGHSINDRIVLFSVTSWSNADHLDYDALAFDYISENDNADLDQSKRRGFRTWVEHAQRHSKQIGESAPSTLLDPLTAQGFFGQVPKYYSKESLLELRENTVSDAAWQTVLDHVNRVLRDRRRALGKPQVIVDMGGGTGYFSMRLARETDGNLIITTDLQHPMLAYGQSENKGRSAVLPVHFVAMDALKLACKPSSVDIALVFCSIHCIPDKPALFAELKRAVAFGGYAIVLTFDPQNLHRTLYHELFPGYLERDLSRYVSLESLRHVATRAGFRTEATLPIPYHIQYTNVDEFVAVVRDKPFSTFSYYTEEEFNAGLKVFREKLDKRFGPGKVVNQGEMTLLVLKHDGNK